VGCTCHKIYRVHHCSSHRSWRCQGGAQADPLMTCIMRLSGCMCCVLSWKLLSWITGPGTTWAKGHYTEGAELIDSVLDVGTQGGRESRLPAGVPSGALAGRRHRERHGHALDRQDPRGVPRSHAHDLLRVPLPQGEPHFPSSVGGAQQRASLRQCMDPDYRDPRAVGEGVCPAFTFLVWMHT